MKVKDKNNKLATISRIKGVNMREKLEKSYVDPYETYGEFEVPTSNGEANDRLKDEMDLIDMIEDWKLDHASGAAVAEIIKAKSPRFNTNEFKAVTGLRVVRAHLDRMIDRYYDESGEGSEQ